MKTQPAVIHTPKHYSKFAGGENPYVFSAAWEKQYKCKFCDSFFATETAVYQHCKREILKENTCVTHTPTPWRIGDAGHTVFGPPNGNPSPYTVATELDKEDAAFIVRACNSHSKMLLLLKEISILYRELNISDELEKRILETIDEASK